MAGRITLALQIPLPLESLEGIKLKYDWAANRIERKRIKPQ